MASTYTPIATTTLGSNASSITFSSIAGTYTDLVLILIPATVTGASDVRMRFNSDTGSNYSSTILFGTGSSAGSARDTSATSILCDYYATAGTTLGNSNRIFSIMNYANATTYKTMLSRANNAGGGVDAIVGLWRSTSAITSVTLILDTAGTANYATGTIATLYGITAA